MSKILSAPFDLKEDLRLRILDLEKKLAESQEERNKMEKTCNALLRSFREEERMRYIALNRKYEKFLQDCTVRKRRNEIILRSLCRIEERSKALFAKTERLKLLKDRYISYLKINDLKKDEVSSEFLSLSQKTVDDFIPKSVHWKTPLATDQKKKKLEEIEDVFSNRTFDAIPSVTSTELKNYEQEPSKEVQGYEGRKSSESIAYSETFCANVPQNKLNLVKIESDFCKSLAESLSISLKNEKLFKGNNRRKSENDCVSEHESSNDKFNDKNLLEISGIIGSHQESVEKLEKTLSLKEEYSDDEAGDKKHCSYDEKKRKNDKESSEKDSLKKENNLQDESLPKINPFVPFLSSDISQDEEKGNAGKEMKAYYQKEETSKSLPMGLDGIDYQNETYPESYYEQPVHHHTHTNIVADVILEEDETEQDGEEEEKEKGNVTVDYSLNKTHLNEDSDGSSTWVHSPGKRILDESNLKSAMNEGYATDAICFNEPHDQIKSQKANSEKSSEGEQSDSGPNESKINKNERLFSDRSDKNKAPVKNTLIHLLESDSESYQIEHGDGVSENEVSDFDLSFQ